MCANRIWRWLTLFCVLFAWCDGGASAAEPPVRVLVSFSILEDIVREIGGAEVAVTSLIGPDSDAHVFEPSPDQLRLLAQSQLFVVNGLGLEVWETRLVQSAQYHGPVVVASHGITPIETAETGAVAPVPDPHAWQDVKNAEIYAVNIAQALQEADPERADDFRRGLDRYRAELETLDGEVSAQLAGIPPQLTLPADRPRPPLQTHAADVCRATVASEDLESLRQLSQANQVTLYMSLLAVFSLLLARQRMTRRISAIRPRVGRPALREWKADGGGAAAGAGASAKPAPAAPALLPCGLLKSSSHCTRTIYPSARRRARSIPA